MRRFRTVLDWHANRTRLPFPDTKVLLWNGQSFHVGRVNEAGDILVGDGKWKSKRFMWAALTDLNHERTGQAFLDKLTYPPGYRA